MNPNQSSASLKSMAKGQLLGNYGTAVGAVALYTIFVFILNAGALLLIDRNSLIGQTAYYTAIFIISLLTGLFTAGEVYLYLKLTCNQPVFITDLFYCFSHSSNRVLRIQLVLSIIAFICELPVLLLPKILSMSNAPGVILVMAILVIAGISIQIYFSLMFSQVYYLMLDFPDYSAKELLNLSVHVMKGHKGRFFYLRLSFIPFFLLGILSCCIGLLWVKPYKMAAYSNFYLDLMKKK